MYFLYGENNFLLKRSLESLLSKVKEKDQNIGLEVFDFNDDSQAFEKLKISLKGNSLFSKKKVIICEDLIENIKADQKEEFSDIKESLVQSLDVIIFFENKVPRKNDALFTWFSKNAKTQEYALLKGATLDKWIKDKVNSANLEIEDQAIKFLSLHCQSDMWLLNNELDKIIAYKQKGVIALVDCKHMVKDNLEINIFNTMDKLINGDKAQALHLLRKHIKEGESPQAILALVATQVRNMLIIRQAMDQGINQYALAKATGLNPFIVHKTAGLIQAFDAKRLKSIFNQLLIFDVDTKTGKLDSEVSLELLVNLF